MSKRRLLFIAAAVALSTAVFAAEKAKQPTLAEKTASRPRAAADAGSGPADGGTAAPPAAQAAHDGGTAKPAPRK